MIQYLVLFGYQVASGVISKAIGDAKTLIDTLAASGVRTKEISIVEASTSFEAMSEVIRHFIDYWRNERCSKILSLYDLEDSIKVLHALYQKHEMCDPTWLFYGDYPYDSNTGVLLAKKDPIYYRRRNEIAAISSKYLDVIEYPFDKALTVLIAGQGQYKIKADIESHGVSSSSMSLITKYYRGILWHEVAHLLGAKDHYDYATRQPLPLCCDAGRCVMQYEPDGKEIFCTTAIKELNKRLNHIEPKKQ